MAWNTERLKRLRASLNMIQSEFAAYLGVSTPTIKNWETGGAIPELAQKLLDRIEKEQRSSKPGHLQPA